MEWKSGESIKSCCSTVTEYLFLRRWSTNIIYWFKIERVFTILHISLRFCPLGLAGDQHDRVLPTLDIVFSARTSGLECGSHKIVRTRQKREWTECERTEGHHHPWGLFYLSDACLSVL